MCWCCAPQPRTSGTPQSWLKAPLAPQFLCKCARLLGGAAPRQDLSNKIAWKMVFRAQASEFLMELPKRFRGVQEPTLSDLDHPF